MFYYTENPPNIYFKKAYFEFPKTLEGRDVTMEGAGRNQRRHIVTPIIMTLSNEICRRKVREK